MSLSLWKLETTEREKSMERSHIWRTQVSTYVYTKDPSFSERRTIERKTRNYFGTTTSNTYTCCKHIDSVKVLTRLQRRKIWSLFLRLYPLVPFLPVLRGPQPHRVVVTTSCEHKTWNSTWHQETHKRLPHDLNGHLLAGHRIPLQLIRFPPDSVPSLVEDASDHSWKREENHCFWSAVIRFLQRTKGHLS